MGRFSAVAGRAGTTGTRHRLARLPGVERARLIASWVRLTREVMPALAGERGWPVRFDHCFQHILLDNTVGGRWRESVAAPAWRNALDTVLMDALALGNAAVGGRTDLGALNARSLAWRKKGRRIAPPAR